MYYNIESRKAGVWLNSNLSKCAHLIIAKKNNHSVVTAVDV